MISPETLLFPKNADGSRHSALCDKGHTCEQAVVQNPETGRWFVTFGHAGFNSRANNGSGVATRRAAVGSVLRHQRPAFTQKIESTVGA
jgi:hypothetical protein